MIPQQGFHTMSNAQYHKGDGAFAYSKSLLALLLPPGGNPYALKASQESPGEDIFSRKSLDTYNPGTAVHTWFLERDKFDDEIVVMPKFSGKGSVAARKAWEGGVRASKRLPIMPSTEEMIRGMNASLHSGRYEIARGILESEDDKFIERSGFWRDKKTGIWLKTRPDLIASDMFVWDLKKYGRDLPFIWQAKKLHYDLQAYMMLLGTSIITGVEHTKAGFIVLHSKSQTLAQRPTYPIEVFWCSEEFLDGGREKFDLAMGILADCLERDEWPGVPDKIQLL